MQHDADTFPPYEEGAAPRGEKKEELKEKIFRLDAPRNAAQEAHFTPASVCCPSLCALAANPPRLLVLLLSQMLTAVHLLVTTLLSLLFCGWGACGVCTVRPNCLHATEESQSSPAFAPFGNLAHYCTRGGSPPWHGDKLDSTGWHLYLPWASVASLVEDLGIRFGREASFYVAPCNCPAWLGCLPYTLPYEYAQKLHKDDARLALAVVGAARIVVVLGFPEGSADIGLFVSGKGEDLAPGAAWLLPPLLPSPGPSQRSVAALAALVLRPTGRPPNARVHFGAAQMLTLHARKALTAHVNAAWARTHAAGEVLPCPGTGADSGADACSRSERTPAALSLARTVAAGSSLDDFKLVLPPALSARMLGRSALSALLAALEAVRCDSGNSTSAQPLALGAVTIILRRTAATGRWINFHSDSAGLTAVVPLEGDAGATVGGQPLYALSTGMLLAPRRTFGLAVAHHGDVAHGVTRLQTGTRYALYALVAREDAL